MARARRIGEFELIARYFAPLARGFKGAGGLQSDNAFLPAIPRATRGQDRHDVAGVHFPPTRSRTVGAGSCASAPPICRRRRGSLHLSTRCRLRRAGRKAGSRASRAAGRRSAALRHQLCGGDTVVSPGPLTVTITAFDAYRGARAHPPGARLGDWVSGTIGDGALGLPRRAVAADSDAREALRRPGRARAARPGASPSAADVSDGLLADAGHIALASRLPFGRASRCRLRRQERCRSAGAVGQRRAAATIMNS
jgi:thiamine-monophosphate kinase